MSALPSLLVRLARARLRQRRPSYLIAFVTQRCNLRCGACCPAARQSSEHAELPPRDWAQALEGADALLHLTVTGGEPFLRDDLTELIIAAVRACGVPRVSINTNGLLTERIVDACRRLVVELPRTELCLSVSLDGLAPLHDRLRGREGSWAAARATLVALASLRGTHFDLRITSLLQPDNAGQLEDLLSETDRWQVDQHEIALVRDVTAQEQLALRDEYSRLSGRQLRRLRPGIEALMAWRVRREVMAAVRADPGSGRCSAGSRMVELFSDGTLRGCELAQMWPHSQLGRVGPGVRVVDLLRQPRAAAFRQRAQRCRCSFECAAACNAIFAPLSLGGEL